MPTEIPWEALSPRTAAILRTVVTSSSQGYSTREIARGFSISSCLVYDLMDEARDELRLLGNVQQ